MVTCMSCGAELTDVTQMTVKRDAWLVYVYDEEEDAHVPEMVTVFDHTVLECPECGEEFEDRALEDAINWGSVKQVEVL